MSYYYKPKKPKKVKTIVYCAGYSIEQQTKSEQEEIFGESKMVLELTFLSNDYSPNKFDNFMKKFSYFLDKNY
ncbi:hypothetical protein KMC73_gp38 [Paenibacillus phage Wanderer]|uniref:Uncharacterized protein n=2 Tax=Wanderervirus wanderer TaxID=2845749 RepID=A0A345ARK1_9CAUD|nr:hypothetical protein KMC73_gp38 [Paenibacillus phage Wanderer]AXF39455.1 hypothetical protein WANDERER_38 [Paenibacillus phage Wanderer]AXF40338.1 hypothetical protein LINCOLNB_38 [Paenibacillus phage LincolnB]